MPAPDFDTIYDQETALEDALVAVLPGYGLNPFTVRGDEELPAEGLPADRVDVTVALGEVQGHKSQVTPGQWAYDAWRGQIKVDIYTQRRAKTDPAYDAKLHRRLRARVRRAFQYFEGKFTEAVLPYHTLTQVREAGTTPTIDAGDDTDVSTILFDCIIGVRSGQWPA